MANQLELISSIYSSLEGKRQTTLDRARDCSALTIPELIPPSGHEESSDLEQPIHSIGEQGVNNLASKLMVSLLPPNSPFFRLSIDAETANRLMENKNAKTEIEKSLAKIEKQIATTIETQNIRNDITLALKLLIVSGNALLYMPDEGGIKIFSLENYVIKRDSFGNVLEIITKETVNVNFLQEEIRNKIISKLNEDEKKKDLDLYTRIFLNDNSKYTIYQEISEIILPETEIEYELDNNPYIPLRWSSIKKENYGRGLVLGIKSDLEALENIYQSTLDITKLMAAVKFLVNPNSNINIKKLATSRNGDFITGNANDISVLRVEKFNELQITQSTMQDIYNRISGVFLLNQSIQRQAERVTATEINTMAQDLESSLGGIYSMLSQELQLPLIRRIISQLEKKGLIPALPSGVVSPMITTGLEALGRNYDLNKLNTYISQISQLGPQAMSLLNIEEVLKRTAISLGVDTDGLIKDQQQVMQEQQDLQNQQMAQSIAPNVANQILK